MTSAFCHDRYGLWHILFNMLLLYWFGQRLEQMYGSTEFLLFYLAAAVYASLAYVALAYYSGSSLPAIGASGAIMKRAFREPVIRKFVPRDGDLPDRVDEILKKNSSAAASFFRRLCAEWRSSYESRCAIAARC